MGKSSIFFSLNKVRVSFSISLFLFFSFLSVSYSQDSLAVKMDMMQLDPLGRLLLFNSNTGDIACFSTDLKAFSTNQINVWSSAGQLDANDPLKASLFFPDVNSIYVFDELLSAYTQTDFNYYNLFNIQAACSASLGGFWLFSRDENKIIRIEQNGQRVFESLDLRFVMGSYPTVGRISELGNYLLLSTADSGFYFFDFFGNQETSLAEWDTRSYSISSDLLYMIKEEILYGFEPSLGQLPKALAKVPCSNCPFVVGRNYFFYLSGDYLIRVPLSSLDNPD